MKKIMKWIIGVVLILIIMYLVFLMTNNKAQENLEKGFYAGKGETISQVV